MARQLRNKGTLGEVMLWRRLKRSQFMGYDFHRQKPLLSFIVDFYCHIPKLIVELDGPIHEFQIKADQDRESILHQMGYQVVRFKNEQVLEDWPSVEEELTRVLTHP